MGDGQWTMDKLQNKKYPYIKLLELQNKKYPYIELQSKKYPYIELAMDKGQ